MVSGKEVKIMSEFSKRGVDVQFHVGPKDKSITNTIKRNQVALGAGLAAGVLLTTTAAAIRESARDGRIKSAGAKIKETAGGVSEKIPNVIKFRRRNGNGHAEMSPEMIGDETMGAMPSEQPIEQMTPEPAEQTRQQIG